jgi:hypothetical protein
MPHGVIYGLHDPESNELRYIGQTIQPPKKRLGVHVSPWSLRRRSYLSNWIASVLKRGSRPTILVRGQAEDQAGLDALEVQHISEARASGVRLVNLSNGGGGRAGYVPTVEEREKQRLSNLGKPHPKHTDEWKTAMSKKMKGRNTNTPQHIARIAALKVGVPRSDETKAKISAAKMGQRKGIPLPERVRQKIGASRMTSQAVRAEAEKRRGVPRSSEVVDRMRSGWTLEARARLSASQKARRERERIAD